MMLLRILIIGLCLLCGLMSSNGIEARPPEARLETILVLELPREAQVTLRLIKAGGPFPYTRDGVVFQNRERLLPQRPRGYYREYTVPTPGARDRGAQRIIAGRETDYYYTLDHYRSFKRILEK